MQNITTRDVAVALILIDREISRLENSIEYTVLGKTFTEQKTRRRKDNLKKDRWYQDLLKARENLEFKVNFGAVEESEAIDEMLKNHKQRT